MLSHRVSTRLLVLPVLLGLGGCMAAAVPLAGMLGADAGADALSNASSVTERYTDEQFQVCLDSLTLTERQQAEEDAALLYHVPVVGHNFVAEQIYLRYEEICQEKGILPVIPEE